MWLDFKKYLFSIIFIGTSFYGVTQQAEGLIFNLKQNWVQYDVAAESFLPAISQSGGNVISFKLDGNQYGNYKLYLKNSSKAYLFYENLLLTQLVEGEHYFAIDSLLLITKTSHPLLSIYGEGNNAKLNTLIVTNSFVAAESHVEETHVKNKSFTSFFIIASILLLAGLILLKINSSDMFSQYANISRALNLSTIDEIIYKGRFFVNPGIQMIGWMSLSAAFVLYYLLTKSNIQILDFAWIQPDSIFFSMLQLLVLAIGFMVLFVFRFVMISIMATIFDMKAIKNIHFASHLRLTFYLVLLLQVIITLDYFSIIPLNTITFLILIFGALFSIIVLIGFRLSNIVRHPFVQIFLYLCGTEIFLFVSVYKLVVG